MWDTASKIHLMVWQVEKSGKTLSLTHSWKGVDIEMARKQNESRERWGITELLRQTQFFLDKFDCLEGLLYTL